MEVWFAAQINMQLKTFTETYFLVENRRKYNFNQSEKIVSLKCGKKT